MTADELLAYASLLDSLGTLALLIAAIVALLRGLVITARHHQEVVDEKDERIEYLEAKVGALKSKLNHG